MKTGGNPQNLKRSPGPGRPPGLPNKATREFKDAARSFLESEAYRMSAERRMVSGKAPHLELFFFQHAYGKPIERTEHSGPQGGPMPFTWRPLQSSSTSAPA